MRRRCVSIASVRGERAGVRVPAGQAPPDDSCGSLVDDKWETNELTAA